MKMMVMPSNLSSVSSLSSSFHVDIAPLNAKTTSKSSRVYSPSFELRTPQALGASPRHEENEKFGSYGVFLGSSHGLGYEARSLRNLVKAQALGSLNDVDMFSDPRYNAGCQLWRILIFVSD